MTESLHLPVTSFPAIPRSYTNSAEDVFECRALLDAIPGMSATKIIAKVGPEGRAAASMWHHKQATGQQQRPARPPPTVRCPHPQLERRTAVQNFEAILSAADGIMIRCVRKPDGVHLKPTHALCSQRHSVSRRPLGQPRSQLHLPPAPGSRGNMGLDFDAEARV